MTPDPIAPEATAPTKPVPDLMEALKKSLRDAGVSDAAPPASRETRCETPCGDCRDECSAAKPSDFDPFRETTAATPTPAWYTEINKRLHFIMTCSYAEVLEMWGMLQHSVDGKTSIQQMRVEITREALGVASLQAENERLDAKLNDFTALLDEKAKLLEGFIRDNAALRAENERLTRLLQSRDDNA